MFNGTDRGAIKNVHIVNARKGYCTSKVIISKKGQNYLIERQTLKKTNQKGVTHASTHLNLFECDETGTPERDISEEQRRETEKILRDIVGNLDDFLLTSLASQGDINRFVSQGSAVRKAILAKFLRLDVLDALLDQVKQELLVAKRALRGAPERQFDIQIVDKISKLKARTSERNAEATAIEKIAAILNDINLSLESQADEMYTQTEVDDQVEKIAGLQRSLDDLHEKLSVEGLQRDTLQTTLAKMQTEIEDIDFDDIRKTKEELDTTERDLLVFSGEIDTKAAAIRSDKRAIKKLKDVPCEDSFPTCKYIVSAKKAENTMLKKHAELVQARKKAGIMKSVIKKLLQKNVDEKLEQKQDFDEKRYSLTQDLSVCDMSILGLEGYIANSVRGLEEAKAILSRMRLHLCSSESAKERNILIRKKKIADEKLVEAKRKAQDLSERIGLLTAEIDQLRKEARQFEKNNQLVYVLGLLQKALSRDGIPLQIVKKKLPVINHEIANILQGVTGFTVELEVDNSSGMDIMLNYGDSKRVIECCSGMEKMMSSLAIRTALVRVSSLPKCDTLIIDEGFGALDASNVEACTALLRSLTKTFRLILIISHIDTVRDVVDNVIEISSTAGHDAKVKFL